MNARDLADQQWLFHQESIEDTEVSEVPIWLDEREFT